MLDVALCTISDGLKESNVITKTFTVNDSGLPSDDDNGFSSDLADAVQLENDYRPNRSKFGPQPSLGSAKAKVFTAFLLIICVSYFCMNYNYDFWGVKTNQIELFLFNRFVCVTLFTQISTGIDVFPHSTSICLMRAMAHYG